MQEQKQKHWTFEDYYDGIITSINYTKVLLLEFARYSKSSRDKIIYRFIAKSAGLLESILILSQRKHFHECWILFRALVDRIIHLWYLNKHDDFEVFNEWTFVQKFETNNKLKSDKQFSKKINRKELTLTDEQLEKYKRLKSSGISWSRPKAEQVAKDNKLSFIYKYGYDIASTKVHPMSDEGMQDLNRLTGLEWDNIQFDNPFIILNNTLAVYNLLIEESLNISDLKWSAVMYNFTKEIMDFLESNNKAYKNTYKKIVIYGKNENKFCE